MKNPKYFTYVSLIYIHVSPYPFFPFFPSKKKNNNPKSKIQNPHTNKIIQERSCGLALTPPVHPLTHTHSILYQPNKANKKKKTKKNEEGERGRETIVN